MRRFFSYKLIEPHLKESCDLILSLKDQKFGSAENEEFYLKHFKPRLDPFEVVKQDMLNFSKNIESALESEEGSLDYVTQYYYKNPGKLIRPTIALILSRSLNAIKGDIRESTIHPTQMVFSQVIEMIHCASLIHDDVIDNSETRRGQVAIHKKVGKKQAVLGGDYLVATASLLCTTASDIRLMNLISTIFSNLTRGELIQAESSSTDIDSLLVEYVHKTYYKTASLLSNCCKGIGLYGKEAEKCFEFGKHLGLAFQYVDDILDYLGSSKLLGKPALNDLASGVVTGPILFAACFNKEVVEMIERKFSEDGDLEVAKNFALEFGIETTRRLALIHLSRAIEAISFIGEGSALDSIISIAGKVYGRVS